jgi:hypothetical protein
MLILVSDQMARMDQRRSRIVQHGFKITLRQGDMLPVRTDTELIDRAEEITGWDARFLEDFAE